MKFSTSQMGNTASSSSIFLAFKYVCLVFCLSLLHSTISAATPHLTGNDTDQLSLLAFKQRIRYDPFGALSSWNTTVHFCNWQGVTCRNRHKRVTMLELPSLKLSGSLSPHIGNLSFLNVLRLHNNSFVGKVPPEIGRLRRLQTLRLNNNSLVGEIPVNLSRCSDLIALYLSNNRLVGKIPSELGSLSKLGLLYINTNGLSGAIPPSFGNLSSLSYFLASKNNLVGHLPDSLFRLRNLTIFAINENHISGTVPVSLFNHSSLIAIDIGSNQIKGSLPPDIGTTLPNIQFLSIFDDWFTGSFPVSLSNATNLDTFLAGFNFLTGNLPNLENLHRLRRFAVAFNQLGSREADDLNFLSSLTNASNLELLHLNDNNFGGVLPLTISNLSTILLELNLSYNQISGYIPADISKLVNLVGLYVGVNRLTGVIPPEIGKIKWLQDLALLDNNFSGNIPSSLGNLTLLTRLSLRVNNLRGSIPSSLGKCQHLEFLELGRNKLSGEIPKEIFNLLSLSMALDLSHNNFAGAIPMEIGQLKNLGYLDFSENKFSNEIPASLGQCVRLETLDLHGNFLQGTIPSSLTNLRGLQTLDISRNNLSGEIPQFLAGFMFLQKLNLSFNYFEGNVPREGIFRNMSAISVRGNKLCGGIHDLHLPICSSKGSEKTKSTLPLKLAIAIPIGFLVLTLFLCALYFFWYKKTSKSIPSQASPANSFLNTSYQSLLKATDGFSSSNLIGVGSFGSVYKGTFELDGTVVAVKVLNLFHRGASKSFIAECEALRNIRHRNLVKVLTACSGIDYEGNDFKALVYEFMANGSLNEWLHPSSSSDDVENEEQDKKLNFDQRLNIAIDVAFAVDYLHHESHTPIIHCDLKPSNVLLDDDMTAHVGDFGLARFMPQADRNNLSGNQTSSTGLRGSIGYAPPEYGMGSEISTSGDVYSYGILLLEMFTGKGPTDNMFQGGFTLHNFAKASLLDGAIEIADPVIVQEDRVQRSLRSLRFRKLEECMASVIKLGVECTGELPRERTNIREVSRKLNSVRDIISNRQ